MLPSPLLRHLPRYPVTGGVALAAAAITLTWWTGRDIDPLLMNARVWSNFELWRALTSTLPHVNFLHLAFNLYWLWKFGTLIERVFGHARTTLIYLLLAFGSSLAEFVVFAGGVGLSGVGYGLWGMLWVLQQRDTRFAGAVDRHTSQLFVIWFFICIFTTLTGTMLVANVAHASGAGLGALLGWVISGSPIVKRRGAAALVAVLVLEILGATMFWTHLNLSTDAGLELERLGVEALKQNNPSRGAQFLEAATKMRHAPARAWFNLAIAYESLDRYDAAATAFQRAAELPDAEPDLRQSAQRMRTYMRDVISRLGPVRNAPTNILPVRLTQPAAP